MKKLLLMLPVMAIVFTSCKDKAPLNETYSLPDSLKTKAELLADTTTQMVNPQLLNDPSVQPVATTTKAEKLNPAHGQPGHRCDIAVGEPLSLPIKEGAVHPQPTAQNTAPVKTPKGMNPPHGEPGHRCDIAVGAPLNSAPAKTEPQQTTAKVVTPPGMNPPHGEPGHKCEIPVGAPLNPAKAEEKPATDKPAEQPAKTDSIK